MSKNNNIKNNETVKKPVVSNADDINIKVLDEKYTVVYPFKDLNDNEYEYQVNKAYPREDMINEEKIIALSQERLSQLTTSNNKIGRILIVKSEN